ncbi:sensor domain-containing diguanylate cyclase [Pseudomonas sp. C2B4]|uniref:sensor domain-containing diguanylate cyclase n=1 Tax=Pseudomonas sp. C2B4 TaxID=2735270 RepID=UPI001586A91C|nr:sensor domain-containing diguanylate cyclase [Pseudomonas sp. C2B4]NUU36864.1 GGDEF domain-containing protein [Pseudomonas sp. C2B4]
MSAKSLPRIDLRRLILLFTLLTALITLASSLYVVYQAQRQTLIDSALQSNRAYATKVASSIGDLLRNGQENLAYSADLLAGQLHNAPLLKSEAARLQRQDSSFNVVGIFDATGKVLEASPESLQIKGRTFRTEGVIQALHGRQPMISSAFVSEIGNLVIFVSHPILDSNGQYLGAVGGTVYLLKQSVLHTLISSHFNNVDVQVYVVDNRRRLLYHADPDRIGQMLGPDTAVDAVLGAGAGAMESVDDKGIAMLSGYAWVPDSRWGVICAQSRETALAPLNALIGRTVLVVLPVCLIGFAIIGWVATLITRPLHQLASVASHMDAADSPVQIKSVRAWYIEAARIRRGLSKGVVLMQEKLGHLNRQAQSDPLTGLANRRAMDEALLELEQSSTPFSVMAMDIDHFKTVNDTYGHDAGDVALQALADVVRQSSRDGDLACRTGGEEFTVLLPNTPIANAIDVAERLRARVESIRIDRIGCVTISIGVGSWLPEGPPVSAVLKQADEHLYKAKKNGRNRVEA